jgi:hypothetical protein
MAEQLQRVLSNNPALTAPASEALSCCPPRQGEHFQGAADGLSSNTEVVEQVKNGKGVPLVNAARVSKYDIGWRRVVRHFSPAWVIHLFKASQEA